MSDSDKLLAAFEQFKFALSAAGGGTAGLFVQTMRERQGQIGARRGTFYRLALDGDQDVRTYPLGETWLRESELLSAFSVARGALSLVPEYTEI